MNEELVNEDGQAMEERLVDDGSRGRQKAIEDAHEMANHSVVKTLTLIRQGYREGEWPSLREDVLIFVRQCILCNQRRRQLLMNNGRGGGQGQGRRVVSKVTETLSNIDNTSMVQQKQDTAFPVKNKEKKTRMRCRRCPGFFADSQEQMDQHRLDHHPDTKRRAPVNKPSFRCPQCQRQLLGMQNLIDHVRLEHQLPLEIHEAVFSSLELVQAFIEHLQKTFHVSFVRRMRNRRNFSQRLLCNMSAGVRPLLPNTKHPSRLKPVIDGTCTAFAAYWSDAETKLYHFIYQPVHFGHAVDDPVFVESRPRRETDILRMDEVHFPMKPVSYGDRPMQFVQIDIVKVSVDVYGDRRYDQMFVLVDLYSHFTFARALTEAFDENLITRHIMDIFCTFGLPEGYGCTHGKEVIEGCVQDVISLFDNHPIPLRHIACRNRECFALIRALHRKMQRENREHWVETLPFLLVDLNQQTRLAFAWRKSSYELMFGRAPINCPATVRRGGPNRRKNVTVKNSGKRRHVKVEGTMERRHMEVEGTEKKRQVEVEGTMEQESTEMPITGKLFAVDDHVFIRNFDWQPEEMRHIVCLRAVIVEVTKGPYPYRVRYYDQVEMCSIGEEDEHNWPTPGYPELWISIFDIFGATERVNSLRCGSARGQLSEASEEIARDGDAHNGEIAHDGDVHNGDVHNGGIAHDGDVQEIAHEGEVSVSQPMAANAPTEEENNWRTVKDPQQVYRCQCDILSINGQPSPLCPLVRAERCSHKLSRHCCEQLRQQIGRCIYHSNISHLIDADRLSTVPVPVKMKKTSRHRDPMRWLTRKAQEKNKMNKSIAISRVENDQQPIESIDESRKNDRSPPRKNDHSLPRTNDHSPLMNNDRSPSPASSHHPPIVDLPPPTKRIRLTKPSTQSSKTNGDREALNALIDEIETDLNNRQVPQRGLQHGHRSLVLRCAELRLHQVLKLYGIEETSNVTSPWSPSPSTVNKASSIRETSNVTSPWSPSLSTVNKASSIRLANWSAELLSAKRQPVAHSDHDKEKQSQT